MNWKLDMLLDRKESFQLPTTFKVRMPFIQERVHVVLT